MSMGHGRYTRGGPPAKKKFDLTKPATAQDNFVAPLIYGFSTVRRWIHNGKVTRTGMEGIEPPYILICNHLRFLRDEQHPVSAQGRISRGGG